MSDTGAEIETALGQLRHAYAQLLAGSVRDQVQFAKGLIGPQIERIERVVGDDPRYRSKGSRTISVATLKWWRELVDLNPRDLAPRIDAALTAPQHREGQS